ncbi:MAG: helix-turn-helix domain-containing protein [Geodermatophilaceae bacterium]|jgi:predicted DNA-binding transcriptional regulator AlpA|nr:helix-turn-helix domain-containing protein [Geodermatophilaceae bacterium]
MRHDQTVGKRQTCGAAPDGAAFLSYADVAALAGVSEATLRKYASQGRLPPPDVRVGRTPGWTEASIRRWLSARPGAGARTDLRRAPT